MPTTKTAVELFTDYEKDWAAALEPCISCLLERCPDDERPALNALLERHLDTCPMPPYSPVQTRRLMEKTQVIVDRVMNDPAVMAQQDQYDAKWRDTPWLLKRWRRLQFWWLWGVRLRLARVRHWRRPKPWE